MTASVRMLALADRVKTALAAPATPADPLKIYTQADLDAAVQKATDDATAAAAYRAGQDEADGIAAVTAALASPTQAAPPTADDAAGDAQAEDNPAKTIMA